MRKGQGPVVAGKRLKGTSDFWGGIQVILTLQEKRGSRGGLSRRFLPREGKQKEKNGRRGHRGGEAEMTLAGRGIHWRL